MAVSSLISVGTVPVKALSSSSSISSLVSRPISVGIVPVKAFSYNLKFVSAVSRPISVGIVLVKDLSNLIDSSSQVDGFAWQAWYSARSSIVAALVTPSRHASSGNKNGIGVFMLIGIS